MGATGAEGTLPTVTVTESVTGPPVPLQVKEKVVFPVRGSVRPLPFLLFPVGGVRLDHGPPDAEQLVALEELQESVERSPYETDTGEALMLAVTEPGGGVPL